MLGIIFPVYAVIERPDTPATDFDETLRESRRNLNTTDPFSTMGSSGDVYRDSITLPVQDLGEDFERLAQMSSGDNSVGFFDLTLARKDAKRIGIWNATTGMPDLPKQSRLIQVNRKSGEVIVSIDTPPGLYLHEILPRSFGLNPFGNSTSNIFFLRFRSRSTTK